MHALLQIQPDADIHCASLGALAGGIDTVVENLRQSFPDTNPITFHELRGIPMKQAMNLAFSRPGAPPRIPNYLPVSALQRPGFFNTMRAVRDMVPLFVPYDGPQLVEVYSSIVETIQSVKADLIVVDTLMTAALTACYHLDVRFLCLSPNSLKEFTAMAQPYGAALWKFPAVSSGFDYTVPWYLIPLNIYFMFFTVYTFMTDDRRKGIEKHLTAETGAALRTPLDLFRNRTPGMKILVGSQPEIDFPLVVADDIYPCGPIYLGISAVEKKDPDLAAWLGKSPTIYVNLGSLARLSEPRAVELAMALAVVLETLQGNTELPQYQVLWKIMKLEDYPLSGPDSKIASVLGKWMETDGFRIVEWFEADPSSILKSGNIACSIHHGGANSYHEAVSAGIPQIVLPQWADCFDYAQRVELLGIGRLGSRTAKPLWTAPELSKAVLDVLVGEKSKEMKENATALAKAVEEKGSGAVNAARIILDEVMSTPA
ncbi:family 1 glycosyltransferase [Penicillium malachiteum]|uniref:Family 1 glycosyltransferase n=1 Tax=Penicillium malachiteum TaxID=1324776 RepID=A0AAD6HLF7_9EURO|nr:family 1 glycosyltransferase [Penicillium malachiteum]